MLKKIFLYFNTIRYLKLIQVYYRLYYRLVKEVSPPKLPSNVAANYPGKKPIRFLKSNIHPPFKNKITLLNSCAEIDFVNQNDQSMLWMYNLHYFDWIIGCDHSHRETILELSKKWLINCPFGQKISWDPYPTSLRIINFIKWDLLSKGMTKELKDSIYLQAKYLTKKLEFHLLGNHLLENSRALVWGGLYFDDQGLFSLGEKLFFKEVDEQILADGAHFELSPMYHSCIFEGLLDTFNIFIAYGKSEEAKKLKDYLIKMLSHLVDFSHPDGSIPLFNDSAHGVSKSYPDLISYAESLGFSIPKNEHGYHFSSGAGYQIYRDNGFFFIMNSGEIGASYQPGHAHADALSFEMSSYGYKVFTNPGISGYQIGKRRDFERSTFSQNTIEINGESQSQLWGEFRVGKRARPINIKHFENGSFGAGHDGYLLQPDPAVHNRAVEILENGFILRDLIEGRNDAEVIFNLYVAPENKVIKTKDCIRIYVGDSGKGITLSQSGLGELLLEDCKISAGLGRLVKTSRIFSKGKVNLPTSVVTKVEID